MLPRPLEIAKVQQQSAQIALDEGGHMHILLLAGQRQRLLQVRDSFA